MSLERFTRRELVTIGPDRPAEEAARLMRAKHVGAVIVVEDGQPVGIVTDRDLVV
ncbi:MAG TPA: CBS domain-containing protein, partial [Polyangia bacterium]